jgi:hypothetical protein
VNQLSRPQIRTLILVGFGLSVVSAVIILFVSINSVGFPNSFRGILYAVLPTLISFAELCAWSLLTRIEARDERQLGILRLAYGFLGAQYLLIAIGFNYLFTPIHSFGGLWNTTGLWFNFVGVLITLCGFFLMSRSLVAVSEDERPKVNQP